MSIANGIATPGMRLQGVSVQQLFALFEASALSGPAQKAFKTIATTKPSCEDLAVTINIDDFARIDLRIAKIVTVQAVSGSSNLM